jgi:hypothetical protein
LLLSVKVDNAWGMRSLSGLHRPLNSTVPPYSERCTLRSWAQLPWPEQLHLGQGTPSTPISCPSKQPARRNLLENLCMEPMMGCDGSVLGEIASVRCANPREWWHPPTGRPSGSNVRHASIRRIFRIGRVTRKLTMKQKAQAQQALKPCAMCL